jgi:hypothetical protein
VSPARKAAFEALARRPLTATEEGQIDQLVAGTGDQVGIAALLSAGRTRLGTVATDTFASWAAGTGIRAVIEDKAADAQSPLRASALALRDVLMGGASGIRLDHAGNRSMLAGWRWACCLPKTVMRCLPWAHAPTP